MQACIFTGDMDLKAKRPIDNPAQSGARPPYFWAGGVALAVGLLYAVTLGPTTAFWDTSEYIATAHIMGIPHPPGNPLFVVLARTWEIILGVFGLSTAVRINLFSAFMTAMAHGLWFLVIHHILGHFSTNRRFRLIGAAAATLVSATAFTVWNQATVNEKVYTVSLFTIALLSWLAFRWRERLGRGKDDNILLLMVFILALSVGNHLMAFLAAPALFIFVLLVHPRTLLNPRLYLFGVPAVVLGLSIHLVLPVRSGLDPIINEAHPTCESFGAALGSVVTYGNAGCEKLSAALRRDQYDKPPLLPRQAPIVEQSRNWLQYFDWQWARGLSPTDVLFGRSRIPLTLLFIGLGVLGFIEHYRRDRYSWAYMVSLFVVLSAGLVYYLNFRHGFSFDAADREVRERDYFFIVGFSVWGLMAGLGIASLWRKVSRRSGLPLLYSAPVLGLAFIPLVLNFSWASRARDYSARDWAYNLLMSIEPYGLLFTNGDNDTFPLWYLQEVEGIRRDVTVAVTSYLNTDWYVRQLRQLTRPCVPGQDPDADPTRIICQRPYTAENTDAMYTRDPAEAEAAGKVPIVLDYEIRPPTRSMFREDLDDATIDQVVRSLVPVEETTEFSLGPIRAVWRGGQNMFPWHQFSLAAIQNSLGDRPVYFASSGSAASAFGLRPQVIRQGLAFRLHPGDPADLLNQGVRRNTDVSPLTGVVGPWVDIERTTLLTNEVFVHNTGIPDEWEYWPDFSTIGIPNYYAWVYYALFADAESRGDAADQTTFGGRWNAWTRLGSSTPDQSDAEPSGDG